ncbi:hypothetical protein DEO72_LG7g1560 [Vigna unguiculata]|uniref:Uncharacterized protein n=1 Tax=Vigna unguiculata TaxID=3917 RepID=A0A4D6MHT3_VIGUN|nr:hypothetical protein DEO72_LG7g1560 [Vigna unguiculata]
MVPRGDKENIAPSYLIDEFSRTKIFLLGRITSAAVTSTFRTRAPLGFTPDPKPVSPVAFLASCKCSTPLHFNLPLELRVPLLETHPLLALFQLRIEQLKVEQGYPPQVQASAESDRVIRIRMSRVES